jgi:hypothetical protein
MSVFMAPANAAPPSAKGASAGRTCAHGPFAPLHWALFIAAGVVALTGAALASAAPFNPEALPPAQLGVIDELCRGVIGLGRDEKRFFVCVGSLSNSARDFQGGVASASPASATEPQPGRQKGYAYASFREVRHREELSCGRLGIAPGSDAFVSCVASLDAALFKADNPTQ